MTSSGSEPLAVPPLPPKLRPKPQRRGNIGAGKQYADEDAFHWDLRSWEIERENRMELVKEREQAQERQRERGRDRSERQRDGDGEADNERRVRQRRVQEALYRQQHAEHEAQCAQARARGIASAMFVPLERKDLQFRDHAERQHYDEQCPLGCPRVAPVFMDMQLYRHMRGSDGQQGTLRVKVMLFRRRDVRVQGNVVGYGSYGDPVRRIDTCPCSKCDMDRRTKVWSMQAFGPRSWSVFGDE